MIHTKTRFLPWPSTSPHEECLSRAQVRPDRIKDDRYDLLGGMNVFLAALNSVAPHFTVRGHTLLLSQGHPFSRVEIDLREVAAHKMPARAMLQLRQLRGRWVSYSMQGFRPAEIIALRALLTRWQRQNHQRHDRAASPCAPVNGGGPRQYASNVKDKVC